MSAIRRLESRGSLKIVCLVNQYPKTSHSFIRREIAGLEEAGVVVERVSIRPVSEPLVDPGDRAEAARTRVLLDAGMPRLLAALVGALIVRPRRAWPALVRALRMGWGSERGVLVHLAYLAEACLLRRWCSELDIEHVHAHFVTNPATVAWLCHELGGPTFSFTAHGTNSFYEPRQQALREKISAASLVAAVSQHGRGQLLRLSEREHWDRIHVVRCGADETFLRTSEVPLPDAARIVCVARFEAGKGHEFLLRAAALLAREGLHFELTLVGDGEIRDDLAALCAELGLDRCVRMAGWLGGEDVRAEILAARALVLPSLDEGLPVVLMEALALGRPVIATWVGGIPELVEPGVNGWLVPPGAIEPLAAALREVLSMPLPELAERGRRGSSRVRAQHDATIEARKLAGLLRAAVERTRG